MNSDSVFQYTQPHEFLSAVLSERQKKNPKFSIRAWSRQLGYRNPSILARILRGERNLKPDLAAKIANSIKLSGKSNKYFHFLVLFRNAKTHAEKEIYGDTLASLRPSNQFTNVTIDHFRYIADWYHFAILEMTALKGFSSDPDWIAKRLNGAITSAMASAALERMIRLELLEKLPNGKIIRTSMNVFRVGNGMPSDALRKHHSQMIQIGLESIETQKVDERQILGTTLTLSSEQSKKAKEIILQCHNELMVLAAKRGEGDETFQLNTQLFLLTKKGK